MKLRLAFASLVVLLPTSGVWAAVGMPPLPATPSIVGVTVAASALIRNQPATFDIVGFWLGMTADAAAAVARSQGFKDHAVMRAVGFETALRNQITNAMNIRMPEVRSSVLASAEYSDAHGGLYMLTFGIWPDGSRLRTIQYQVPKGTSAAEWLQRLEAKYGRPDVAEQYGNLNAKWCPRTLRTCTGGGETVRLTAVVGEDGGTILLSGSDADAGLPSQLLDKAVKDFARSQAGMPAL